MCLQGRVLKKRVDPRREQPRWEILSQNARPLTAGYRRLLRLPIGAYCNGQILYVVTAGMIGWIAVLSSCRVYCPPVSTLDRARQPAQSDNPAGTNALG